VEKVSEKLRRIAAAETAVPAASSARHLSEQEALLFDLRSRRDQASSLREIGELSLAIEEETQLLADTRRAVRDAAEEVSLPLHDFP